MKPINHQLRNYRRNSPFTQQDIAELLGNQDAIQISRHETSKIHPQIQIMLLYHILYKISFGDFFRIEKNALIKRLQIRIPNIIDEWKCLDMNDVIAKKIGCLQEVLQDINDPSKL